MGLATLLAIGCRGGTTEQPAAEGHPNRPDLVAFLGGEEAYETVSQPSRVLYTIFEHRNAPEDHRNLAAYEIVAGPVTLSADEAQQLGDLMTDPENYLWEVDKECEGPTNYRFRFERDREGAEPHVVELAYQDLCWSIGVVEDGKVVRIEDFDDGEAPLKKLRAKIDGPILRDLAAQQKPAGEPSTSDQPLPMPVPDSEDEPMTVPTDRLPPMPESVE
jgi:hypothetical protein